MGNLFSLKLDPPPPLRPHKRKQRGPSISEPGLPLTGKANHRSATCGVAYDQSQPIPASVVMTSATKRTSITAGNGSTAVMSSKPRRSSLKMTLKRAYSNASASSNVLTDERRQLVQATWREITEKTGKAQAAVAIFRLVFRACPELRPVFNVEMVPSEELDSSERFLRHARVFANVLDLSVRNVFELETEVGPVLVMFGRRHFYKHQLGFRNEYLTLFAQSISDFIQSRSSESFVNNPEATAAWRLFISYIIHKVKEGYDLECVQARKHSAAFYG